jgi:hypothetical protein
MELATDDDDDDDVVVVDVFFEAFSITHDLNHVSQSPKTGKTSNKVLGTQLEVPLLMKAGLFDKGNKTC